jgi:hypothetical protein
LDVEAAGDDFDGAAFEVAALEAVTDFDLIGATRRLAVRFAVRGDLRSVFTGFDLLLAIWPSVRSTTASCAATDTAPPIEGQGGES